MENLSMKRKKQQEAPECLGKQETPETEGKYELRKESEMPEPQKKQNRQRIVIGVSGASGIPLMIKCLQLIPRERFEIHLIVSESAKLTLTAETDITLQELEALADAVYPESAIGAAPASGSFKTCGMLIVPCSMKTVAGIHGGYADNLLLRAADVTIKEQRRLILAARETPLSPIHLRNLYELSQLPSVRIIPPMMTFYHKPESIDDMVYHIAAKLLEPFGIEAKEYRRWNGL